MDNPRVWTDLQGDPWIEVEPGGVICITPWLRQAIRDKVGEPLPVEEAQKMYRLRLLVPEKEERGNKTS